MYQKANLRQLIICKMFIDLNEIQIIYKNANNLKTEYLIYRQYIQRIKIENNYNIIYYCG